MRYHLRYTRPALAKRAPSVRHFEPGGFPIQNLVVVPCEDETAGEKQSQTEGGIETPTGEAEEGEDDDESLDTTNPSLHRRNESPRQPEH